MCVFNANCIVGFDLLDKKFNRVKPNDGNKLSKYPKYIFDGVPCPNDLAVDEFDERIIYAGGGQNYAGLSVPIFGTIYKCDTAQFGSEQVISKNGPPATLRGSGVHLVTKNRSNLASIAGINMLGGKLFVSELFDIQGVESKVFEFTQYALSNS